MWRSETSQIKQRCCLPSLSLNQSVISGRRAENSSKRVIVFLRDRIELVIMTPGTGDCRAKERSRGGINLLVDQIGEELLLVFFTNQFDT